MEPPETYLRSLYEIHTSGAATPELAYYSPLEHLLSTVGHELDPGVRCIMGLADQGAGLPDGGLFTEDQLQTTDTVESLAGQLPARGVIEVKPAEDDVHQVARGEQVHRYLEQYRLVLVTNYREFVLVGLEPGGALVELDAYSLALSESDFWTMAALPRQAAREHGERFVDFLRRVLLHAAPLASPRHVAWFLASYAREARARIEGVEMPSLRAVRTALEDALGSTFEGEEGDHFFRSTLVQTLFYGTFSAWVLWSRQRRPDSRERFNWHEATWLLHVPMIQALFEQVATPSKIGPQGLRLSEILDRVQAVLNRVDRAEFFSRFEAGQAVQYFYEPFLEAFDPELRKDLGVWYTPPEVVKYMVARVDTVLREELGIADGLADPQVHVLDAACGTGAYLVEVLKKIAATRQARGDALSSHDVKQAATGRVFGFEILPAPFVIAHLQLGLLLQNLGVPLGSNERAGVYLTNALTGWEPPEEPKQRVMFPELAAERDAAERVKQDAPILVVLGNPPYNSFAGMAVEEERALTDAYRTTRRAPPPRGQGLNDLYVRFFRMAERRIVEQTGRGIVCFISNYSWLDGLSFTGMREHYLDAFDRIWIDSLNGDKYRTGKVTPDGRPDPSIFSTEYNREGIQVGTAIALLVRKLPHADSDVVQFRNLWGTTKRQQLLATAEQDGESLYQRLTPAVEIGLPFMPRDFEQNYLAWPALPDLFPVSFPGIQPSRDDVVVDIDRQALVNRMERYFDPRLSNEEIAQLMPRAMESTNRFDAENVRDELLDRGFLRENVVRYCYRPFDVRWLYWEPETKLLDEKRAEYVVHLFEDNVWLGAAKSHRKGYDPPLVSSIHCSRHIVERGANLYPLYLLPTEADAPLLSMADSGPGFNISQAASAYLKGLPSPPTDLFHHLVAVMHAPVYVSENADALRQDWPRVPLPDDVGLLRQSAELGRWLAVLLDSEQDTADELAGQPYPSLGVVSRVGGGVLDPDAGDLAVTAGWGYTIRGGSVTMPGQGTIVERDYTPAELDALRSGAERLDLSLEQLLGLLGETTNDVYLNDVAYWRNVPQAVWDYTLGGYPVVKKWLSYREERVLGRPLRPDEVRYVTEVVKRIAAVLLMGPALDANYAATKRATFDWPPRLEPS